MKPTWCCTPTQLNEGFPPIYQEHGKRHCGFGRSQHDPKNIYIIKNIYYKKNIQIDRLVVHTFKFEIFFSNNWPL
jgi:hypothetical protein